MLGTAALKRFRHTDADGKGSWITHYFGMLAGDADRPAPPIGALHPVAFLVEMRASSCARRSECRARDE